MGSDPGCARVAHMALAPGARVVPVVYGHGSLLPVLE
jgi:hypothetical protein